MKYLLGRWRDRKRYPFSEMPAWLLVTIGGGAFLGASYHGFVLKGAVPSWLATVNQIGHFDAIGTAIGMHLLVLGVAPWVLSRLAARCHRVLYDRWFD
ncbi:MAG: hypothetical protein QM674_19170 [Burkholderiaceae bacterium]